MGAWRLGDGCSLRRNEQARQRVARRGVGAAVDTLRAEVALKGFDDILQPAAVGACDFNPIAKRIKVSLERRDRLALIAGAETGTPSKGPA